MWGSIKREAARVFLFSWKILFISGIASISLLTIAGALAIFGDHTALTLETGRLFDFLENSATREVAVSIWQGFSNVLQWAAVLMLGLGLILAGSRADTILRIAQHFFEGRATVMTLQKSVTTLESMIPSVQHAIGELPQLLDKVKGLESTVLILTDKLDTAQARLESLQRDVAIENLDSGGAEAVQTTEDTPEEETEDTNRQRLNEIREANILRLDSVIESIQDTRRKNKYLRMSRRAYAPIISALARDGLISPAAEASSLELNALTNSYRRRSKKIPNEAIAALEVLHKLLAHEIGPAAAAPVDAPAEPQWSGREQVDTRVESL